MSQLFFSLLTICSTHTFVLARELETAILTAIRRAGDENTRQDGKVVAIPQASNYFRYLVAALDFLAI